MSQHVDINETHFEDHYVDRIGWLRAAVLGANDGIVSTASLIVGVAASGAGQGAILLAGVAGLVAGAMSMAAGEYVSVSSQADSEKSDLVREARELELRPEDEQKELSDIYVGRGLTQELANKVAEQLTAHDALGAHARDELGISHVISAQPVQAALASAAAFTVGGALPVASVLFAPVDVISEVAVIVTLLALATLGALSAYTGGSRKMPAIIRVVFWGALAMGVTAFVGYLFGTVVV